MKLLQFCIVALIVAIQAPFVHGQAPVSTPSELIWHWFGKCSGTAMMGAKFVYRRRTLYERSFPVCRLRRRDVADEPVPRLLKFTFRADPRLFGDEFKGIGTHQVEGNLWKAGGEPEAMLFGVSFIARNQILLNTIHIAEPGKTTRSQLANGLSIETYPIPDSR